MPAVLAAVLGPELLVLAPLCLSVPLTYLEWRRRNGDEKWRRTDPKDRRSIDGEGNYNVAWNETEREPISFNADHRVKIADCLSARE